MTTPFWHGFADMHVVKDREIVIESGDGAVITDTNGKQYIDATAALWFCNAGYGRREIADAVAEQLTRLHAYSSFGAYTTDATIRVAARLASLAPMPNAVVYLASGGSDAIDTAGKLARRYWDVVGKPNKTLMVSREHAYHGMHALGTSLGGMPIMQQGYGGEPFVNEVVRVPAMDVEAVARLFEQRRDEIALFVGEPVIGAGGVYPPTESYWRDITALCRQHDVLLVADEVITGFGRMGTLWGSQRFGIEPDMVTFAKGVTSGYMPLGGVLVGQRVRAPFWDEPIAGAVFRHGYTYSGHSGAAAAALANLDIIEREGLLEAAARLEAELPDVLAPLVDGPLVEEVRAGTGALAAVQLTDPSLAPRVAIALRSHGVLTRALAIGALQVSPPFVTTRADLDGFAAAVSAVVEELAPAVTRT